MAMEEATGVTLRQSTLHLYTLLQYTLHQSTMLHPTRRHPIPLHPTRRRPIPPHPILLHLTPLTLTRRRPIPLHPIPLHLTPLTRTLRPPIPLHPTPPSPTRQLQRTQFPPINSGSYYFIIKTNYYILPPGRPILLGGPSVFERCSLPPFNSESDSSKII